jgi:hypothetical protein
MSIGNTSLHQRGEIPEIVKLPNGRIRVTRRFHKFTREDIDNANLGSLMGDFGDLDTAGEQISNQGYTNCRLISVEVDTGFNSVSNTDSAVLVKTYETLTNLFVQITDDTVTFTENGLKQITRVYRAVSGTTSSTVVGVTALGTGEILASSRIEDNDAFAELTETYVEAGILSRTEDFVGSQDSLVIEAIGPDPSTPSGFSLASKQESNYEGLQTNRFTFLKNDVKLSASEDEIGSQNAITEEWFKPEEGRATKASYSLARKEESDVGGIPTERYTFLRPSILSVQQDFNNVLQRVSVQAFNLDSAAVSAALSEVTVNHKLIATNESDYAGIKTTTFQYQIDESSTVDYELNGLRRVTRTSIAEAGTDYAKTVGISYIDHQIDDETDVRCFLASYAINDTDSFRQVEEVWLESGVLSISESHRYGDSVEVYSVEGIKLTEAQARSAITDLPATAKFYGSRLSNYEGLQTTIYEFFTGSGVISTSISYSYNNKLTRTTIVSIDETPDTPVGSVLIDSKAETRDEFILYTYTFVEGEGVVSTNSSSKYNGALTVVTVTSINEVPVIPVGSTTIEAQVREEDGYLLYTTTYASGAGVVGVSTDTKYDGKLILTTTTSLNQPPTGITNLIRSESSQSDYGTIYTYTTAVGTGEIGRSTDSKYDGALTLTTVTSINAVPSENGALVRSDVSDTDYGQIYTYTYASGSGVIGTSTDSKYDGALTLTTVTSLNAVPSGTGSLIRSDVSDTDYGTIYTYTFASGEGEIGRTVDSKYDEKLTLTTVTSLNAVPDEDGALIRSDVSDTDYGTIYTYTYAEGSGVIGTSTDRKYDNTLTLTTITSLNQTPSGTGALIRSDVSDTDYGTIYTYTYASGAGIIGTSTDNKYNNTLTLTTVTTLNQTPTGTGALVRSDVSDTDYGTIYTYTFASGAGQIGTSTDSKYDGTLTLTTITTLNQAPSGTGALIRSDVSDTDYGTIYTYTFASGSGEIGRTVDNKYNNTLTLTTVTSLNAVPSGTGALIRSDSNDTDYGTIYTYTYASGSGEIGRSTDSKYNGTLTLTTVTSLNAVPDENGYLFRSDSSDTDYGTIYTYTFADGEGMIAESESERYLGKLKIKSETYLNDPDAAVPAGYTLISQDSRDGDFGVITTITSAEGDGEISNNEEIRNDGSIINIFTILGDTPPTAPSGSYLMETSYQAADGYDIYTYYYYTPPNDYEVAVSTTWNKPSTLSWNISQGFYISSVGSTEPVTGTAYVTFSTTPISAIAVADLSVGAVARESVKYEDGTRLVRSTTFTNTYYNNAGGSFTGGDYLGEAAITGAISSSGQNLPSGTVTLGWESVPYFYAGGATIWKTTHTQGVIS